MGSKNETTSTQNQERNPYAPAQPGLASAASGITSWMKDPKSAEAYSGPRVAQMSGRTQSGLDDMYNSTGLHQTQDFLGGTLDGKYLDAGNPYIQQVQDAVRSSVMPSVNARTSAAGISPGSSVDQNLVSRALTDGMSQPLFQSYENERARQMQAAGMMPAVSQQITQNMIGAGQGQEVYDQRNIDAGRQAFEEQRVAGLQPYAAATPLLSQIGGAGGTSSGTSTSVQQTQPSAAQTALGVGMMGTQMATGMFGAAPLAGLFGGGASTYAQGGSNQLQSSDYNNGWGFFGGGR
jgi:hypothetical protein